MDYGKLVFDIGANVGERTKLFFEAGATVVAVEPVSACFAELEFRFGFESRVVTVHKAVGSKPGISKIFLCNPNDSPFPACSSMSRDWVNAVIGARRFWPNNPEYYGYEEKLWQKEEVIEVTTLDILIAEHGLPSFIKIDVEGYEFEVLSGLSCAVPMLSFEFVPEYLNAALTCIDKCAQLGLTKFNCALLEEIEPRLPWTTADSIKTYVSQFRGNNGMYGDVYAIS